MSDHLPECPSGQRKWQRAEAPMYGALCICRELRACEQRVREGKRQDVADARTFGYGEGFAAGVQAAREAVAAMPGIEWVHAPSALDAIDALRGES